MGRITTIHLGIPWISGDTLISTMVASSIEAKERFDRISRLSGFNQEQPDALDGRVVSDRFWEDDKRKSVSICLATDPGARSAPPRQAQSARTMSGMPASGARCALPIQRGASGPCLLVAKAGRSGSSSLPCLVSGQQSYSLKRGGVPPFGLSNRSRNRSPERWTASPARAAA